MKRHLWQEPIDVSDLHRVDLIESRVIQDGFFSCTVNRVGWKHNSTDADLSQHVFYCGDEKLAEVIRRPQNGDWIWRCKVLDNDVLHPDEVVTWGVFSGGLVSAGRAIDECWKAINRFVTLFTPSFVTAKHCRYKLARSAYSDQYPCYAAAVVDDYGQTCDARVFSDKNDALKWLDVKVTEDLQSGIEHGCIQETQADLQEKLQDLREHGNACLHSNSKEEYDYLGTWRYFIVETPLE